MSKVIFFSILIFNYSLLYAADSLNVVGFFPGKVVVSIDGNHYVIKQGQKKQGVRYLQRNGDMAELEVDGVKASYKLGTHVSLSFKKPVVKRKVIYSDGRGMFRTQGSINGQSISFLVDTGATSVAMSSHQAKKLNIQYRLDGRETTARTASGIAKAYLVKLNSVKVGEISQTNVPGIVIVGAYPSQVLLGMSFLNRVKVEKVGATMMLESR